MSEEQEEIINEKEPDITAEQLGAVTENEPDIEGDSGLERSQEVIDNESAENDEDEEDDDNEEAPEKISQEQRSMMEKLTSPEAIIMIPVALILDCIGIILVLFAFDDFGIMDIVGISTIGVWTFFRSKGQEMRVSGSAKEKTEKALAKVSSKMKQLETKLPKATKWAKRLKWLRPLLMIGEVVPYVGSFPLWTICVFLTLIHE